MLTTPGFSSGIQQRQSAGWGQGFSFPGPPKMTLEGNDQARESNITVEAARIRIPEIPAANISINSNPTYNSPVYDFTSNYGNPLNLAFENQLNLQQLQQDFQTFVGWKSSGISGCPTSPANTFTFVSDVDLDTANNRLRFTRQSVKFVDGLLVDNDCDYDFIDITTTDCP